MTDVLGYLQSKGLPLKQAGPNNVHTACVFCGEDPNRRGRLYISTDPSAEPAGLFYCHLCDERGALAKLKKHFGDPVTEDEQQVAARTELYEAATAYYEAQLQRHLDVVEYLIGPDRRLTLETVKANRLGYAPMAITQDLTQGTIEARVPNALYRHLHHELGYDTKEVLASGLCLKYEDSGKVVDSLRGMITIPYVVAGNVVTVRGRSWPFDEGDWGTWQGARYEPPKAKYKSLPGSASRLYGTDTLAGATDVVVTEGEFDALVVRQEGFVAVGAPGATSWQASWDALFEDAKRIWVTFDRDKEGERAAGKLLERFGARARRVELSPEGTKCDPTQWFAEHDADEFRALMRSTRSGGLLITVEEARREFDAVQGQPGLKFNWETLDTLIAPGLQPSQLMVLLAKTGCIAAGTQVRVARSPRGHDAKAQPIEELHELWSGQRCQWDRSVPTFAQSADRCAAQFREIEDVWACGEKQGYTVTTAHGRQVTATAEHPFLTAYGWRKLAELEPGMDVAVNGARGPAGRLTPGWAGAERIGTDRVVSITDAGLVPMYDMAMRHDPHNYLANGVVVHNTGKTIFLLNMMHRLRMVPGQEGKRILFVSLEQTRGEWWDRARRIHRFYNLDADEDDAAEWWADHIAIIDRNRVNENQLRQAVDDFTYDYGGPPDLMCLDYIGYFAHGWRGEAYERTSQAVMALKAIAKDYDIPILAPHQVSRRGADGEEFDLDAARDSGVIAETADFALTMWVPDNALGRSPEEKFGEVYLRIGKSRHGGRGYQLKMQFAPVSLTLVPEGDPLAARARQEHNFRKLYSDDWERAVYRHRTGFEGHITDTTRRR